MQLKDYLEIEGITGTEFANLIDRSQATVSRILRGKNMPHWSTMQEIRAATGGKVQPNDFFEEAA